MNTPHNQNLIPLDQLLRKLSAWDSLSIENQEEVFRDLYHVTSDFRTMSTESSQKEDILRWLNQYWEKVSQPAWSELIQLVFSDNSEKQHPTFVYSVIERLANHVAHDNSGTLSLDPNTDKRALLQLGMYRTHSGASTWGYLFQYKPTAWEKLKTELRKQEHHRLSQIQETRLHQLLDTEDGNQILPIPLDRVKLDVRNFVQKYREHVGCHPFLLGLRELLRRQQGSNRIWRWQVLDVTFTHGAPSPYDSEAVELLRGIQCMIVERTEDSHTWKLHPSVSDRLIRNALSALPTKLHARPTGRLIISDEKRISADIPRSSRGCLFLPR